MSTEGLIIFRQFRLNGWENRLFKADGLLKVLLSDRHSIKKDMSDEEE
jgi:hypothetical protein